MYKTIVFGVMCKKFLTNQTLLFILIISHMWTISHSSSTNRTKFKQNLEIKIQLFIYASLRSIGFLLGFCFFSFHHHIEATNQHENSHIMYIQH